MPEELHPHERYLRKVPSPLNSPKTQVLYARRGCHIEDSLSIDASFRVYCHCAGVLGDGLTIEDARALLARHAEDHVDVS